MQLVSFDIFRTLGLPNTCYLKPENFFAHKAELRAADWVLFPEYWQLNALIYGLNCRVFPSQASYLIGHNKIEMTRAFMSIVPEHVPVTLIQPNNEMQREALWQRMDLPFVAKLPKASMGEGVWLIQNRQDWLDYCARSDVLYVQEYLPIDRDLRVVVVGDHVLSAYWRLQAESGFYNNVARGGSVQHGDVPEQAVALALRVARALGVDHAGFDIAMVDGHPYLLEFNRLFGNTGLGTNVQVYNEVLLDYLGKHSTPKPRSPGLGRGKRRLARVA
jgi:ribosomal protein S6--L-glutamate ligase